MTSSRLKSRNVVLAGHRTSMRLEPELWAAVENIARRRGMTLNQLCTEIARGAGGANFTSAVRTYVTEYYRCSVAFLEDRIVAAPDPSGISGQEALIEWRAETTQGDDFDRHVLWRPAALQRTRPVGLFRAFHQWREVRGSTGRLPTLEELADGPAGEEFIGGTGNLIDVSPDDPDGFVLERLNPVTPVLFGTNDGVRIDRFPNALAGRLLQADMRFVKRTGVPQLYTITQRLGDLQRAYVRLALPVADEHGRVGRVITAVRGLRTQPTIDAEPVFRPVGPVLPSRLAH